MKKEKLMKAIVRYLVALCAFTPLLFAAPPLTLEGRLAELEERVDDVEFQSGLDRIKFGLDFTTAVSESWYKVGQQTTQNPVTQQVINNPEQKYKAHNKWALELNLNMNAVINDYTKFYGRLSMAKNFGMMDALGDSWVHRPMDTDAGRDTRQSGQSIYVSRAYVDLFATPELVATLGRQPSTDGPGSNLKNNAARQATYPALLFNALADAAVITYKPSFAKRTQLAVRAAYGKIYQFDKEGRVRDWTNKSDNDDTNLYYGSFEIQPHLGFFGKDTLFVLSYARLQDLAFSLESVGRQYGAELGVENLGTLDTANVHFESYQAFGLPVNYFVSASYMKGSDGRDVLLTVQIPKADTTSGSITTTTQSFNLGNIFNEKDAYAIHAGLRLDFHRLFKLGGEYFYGSRYWFSLSRLNINDPLNIRNTRGQAFDVYIITQIDRNQFFRLNYTHIYNKWSNRGTPAGGAYGTDEKAKGGYDSTADSIMLTYNVKF